MEKKFFEAFTSLCGIDDDTIDVFKDVNVDKVSANSKGDKLFVYISSNHLIPIKSINKMEKAIANSVFGGQSVLVNIRPSFSLSKAYTNKELIRAYEDSILLLLANKGDLVKSVYMNSRLKYISDHLIGIMVADNEVSKVNAIDIVQVLDNVFNTICNMNVEFDIRIDNEAMEAVASPVPVVIMEDIQENNFNKPDGNNKSDIDNISDTNLNPKTKKKSRVKVTDPHNIYGKDFDGEFKRLSDIESETLDVIVRGKVFLIDSKPIKNDKYIYKLYITDLSDSINSVMFISKDEYEIIKDRISINMFVAIKGKVGIDRYTGELVLISITGIKECADFFPKRKDLYHKKRIELNCHTKMSEMNGIDSVNDIINIAYEWGHSGIAIADLGVVQAFPDAYATRKKLLGAAKKRSEAENDTFNSNSFFKVIYGMVGNVVNDYKHIVTNPMDIGIDCEYVAFDLETTGLSSTNDRIIEIGAISIVEGSIKDTFSSFVNPKRPIPYRITQLTGINDIMVYDAPTIEEVLPKFMEFIQGKVLIAHNAAFDISFIKSNADRLGIEFNCTYIDTLPMSRMVLEEGRKFTLDTVAKKLNVPLNNHHRATDDSQTAGLIYIKLLDILKKEGVRYLRDINELETKSTKAISKLRANQLTLLVASELGRVNLYTLVSDSHTTYLDQIPKIPRSLLDKYRDGILIGSGTNRGELYEAIVEAKADAIIEDIARYYDYLEIQPVGNNLALINDERASGIKSVEDLININRYIVSLGDRLGIPVVATSDSYYIDESSHVSRQIIKEESIRKDKTIQPLLFLRTTDEMMKEFEYLGEVKATEVVIDNTYKIASKIDNISPVRPDRCPPIIDNSDIELRQVCEDRASLLYGDRLPEVVRTRLDKELGSIISNGFAVLYMIARQIVQKSISDGYLVGSRGSVGSSFVACMSGITEVNPLPPHYYCDNCKYSDFESDTIINHNGKVGVDLPKADCPICGKTLIKDGYNIPFETFLGFDGEKEPDIDLNFSGFYQARAHKYLDVIFGEGQTFRAGTISTLADKKAFQYTSSYYMSKGERKRISDIHRRSLAITGIRSSTGQHPGGIVVLPKGENINSFTPIQYPANDASKGVITTHFDYHSIDHNLLKLDLLGHDDPTMIRMLQDMTGVDPITIPLDDPQVMSLFTSTKALGIKPEEMGGCEVGTLGIPEFGTEFVIGMLGDTKPTSFSSLIRISGLSHGTDVWVGNAKVLINDNIATLDTAICTRDDIMTYLISMGMDKLLSFEITESVRKGRGLKPYMESAMLEASVPGWYIESCKKISYMFPKAHAAAYVMMAWRIAYYKIYYPVAYYCAYYSIRASAFSYASMCLGLEHLDREAAKIDNLEAQGVITKKDKDTRDDMKLVREMYARGIEFVPIDIYKAKASMFQVIEGKIMPSFTSLDGMGISAAEGIEEESKRGEYTSKEDFRIRTKVSKTTIELMDNLNLLSQLRNSDQMSLWDYIKN